MMLDLVPAGQHGPQGWTRALLLLGAGTMTAAWLALWVALFGLAAGIPVLLPGPLQELAVLGGALVAWRLVVSPLGQRWVRTLFTVATLLAAVLAVWALYYHAWVPLDPRWIANMLHVARGVTGAVLWANLHLLFWLSLVPFATAWMGENHFASVPTALYGAVQLMAGVAMAAYSWSWFATAGDRPSRADSERRWLVSIVA